MPNEETDPGEVLRLAGWRQGSCLDKQALVALDIEGTEECDCAVVVSQDCDLVREVSVEPEFEMIAGRLEEKPDGNLSFGRNPRALVVPVQVNGASRFLKLRILDRWTLPKKLLTQFSPSASIVLARSEVRLIADWLAKRYTRPAFPDAFNDRLEAADGKLEKLFKKSPSEHVSAILFMLDEVEDELPEGTPYHLAIWVVVVDEAYQDETLQPALEEFGSTFQKAIGSCPGIEVVEIDVRSEADVTMADLRQFLRFDRDYRSHSKPGSALPPQGT